MKSTSLTDLAQLGATLLVAVGIVLVILEMRQAKQLATVAHVESAYDAGIETQRQIVGEQLAESYARLCFAPETLTDADYVVLDAFFSIAYYQAERARVSEELGEFGSPAETAALGFYSAIARSERGRWWLRWRIKHWPMSARTLEQIQAAIEYGPTEECSNYLADFRGMKL